MPRELTCKFCGEQFVGRKQAQFCCDKHRCLYHYHRNQDMAKQPKDPTEVEPPVRGKLSGAGARRKGARGENEVCKILTRIVGEKHVRNLDQTREGGGDVSWGPFLLEVKTTETVSMPAWQRQAVASAVAKDMVPAVVWRRKGDKWWLAMPFEEFVTIFEALRVAALNSVTGGQNGEKDTTG